MITGVQEGWSACSYARQSIDREAGIAYQRQENQRVAAWLNLDVVLDLADNAVSGTKVRGPETGYGKMLAAWDAGEIDVVIVTKVARLIRNAYRDIDDFMSRKMRVIVGSMLFDLERADHRFLFSQQAMYATFEVEEKEDRRAPVISAAREAGHPKAGKAPFGYEYVSAAERRMRARKDGLHEGVVPRLVVVAHEADVLREVADSILGGERLAAICRSLDRRGVRTHAGVAFKPSSLARSVLLPAVAALLPPIQGAGQQNPRTVNPDECKPGNWEPILPKDRWYAVRGVLLADDRRTNGGATARKHLLSNLMSCGECFLPMKSGLNRHRQRIYRCKSERHNSRLAEGLDLYVEEMVIARLSASDARHLVRRQDGVDLSQLEGERAEWSRRKSEAKKALRAGSINADDLAEMNAEYGPHLARIDAALARARTRDPLVAVVDNADVRAAWSALPLERKRVAIATLMTITAHPLGAGGRARTMEAMRASVTLGWKVDQWPEEGEDLPTLLLPNGDHVPDLSARTSRVLAVAVDR